MLSRSYLRASERMRRVNVGRRKGHFLSGGISRSSSRVERVLSLASTSWEVGAPIARSHQVRAGSPQNSIHGRGGPRGNVSRAGGADLAPGLTRLCRWPASRAELGAPIARSFQVRAGSPQSSILGRIGARQRFTCRRCRSPRTPEGERSPRRSRLRSQTESRDRQDCVDR
jgi:hypothetical protein